MNPISTLTVFLTEGGPVTYVISATFLVGAVLAVERAIAVVSATRQRPHHLVAETMGMIDRNNVTGALELCRGSGTIAGASLAEVLAESVAPSGPIVEERLRERGEHALSLRAMLASKRIDLLSTVANTATMLGLLGTVVALADVLGPSGGGAAAPAIGAAGGALSASLLNAGIARALSTTALGIVAAIPLLLAQSFLRSRIEEAVCDARAASESLASVLVKRSRAEEAARAVLAREKGRFTRERAHELPSAPAAAPAVSVEETHSTITVR